MRRARTSKSSPPPTDVRVGSGRIVQPDVFVVCGHVPDDREGPVVETPLICAEVTSTNRVYDRVTKRYLYAEAGVAEYWIVDPGGVIERCTGAQLATTERLVDHHETSLLPGFSLDLAKLFDRR